MDKVVLVTVSDGAHEDTQDKITELFTHQSDFGVEVHPYTWDDITRTAFYKKHKALLDQPNPLANGRAYKPYVIGAELARMKAGYFLIYNDCSPELWEVGLGADLAGFDLKVLKDLCLYAGGILVAHTRWSTGPFSGEDDLGMATFKNFTTNLCMDKMGLRALENCYMPPSGFWCFRKSKEVTSFVKDWLIWNTDTDCLPKDPNALEAGKLGLAVDQSISGLLLAKRNQKYLVAPPYSAGDLHPINFLTYCRKDLEYRFVESNPEHIEA
jgi:hypothetical protein